MLKCNVWILVIVQVFPAERLNLMLRMHKQRVFVLKEIKLVTKFSEDKSFQLYSIFILLNEAQFCIT